MAQLRLPRAGDLRLPLRSSRAPRLRGYLRPLVAARPSRTAYRYLQHYIQHPALWKYLKDGTLRSWGAKSLEESGRHGEPFLTGDGFARIGEGSGSTNMLTGSGVDEAWATGTQLGEAVIELLRAGKPFTQQNLAATYEASRGLSWVERGAREAENARNGFQGGIVKGMIGMALAGLTHGKFSLNASAPPAHKQIRPFPANSSDALKLKDATKLAIADGRSLHDALLSARGWPEIPFDGRLLVTQQDALLIGGKVQAMPGFADHVAFHNAELCIACEEKTCIAMCSGQAITLGTTARPPSSAKSASTAAPASGTAANPPTASTVTSSSAPAPAACIRRKIDHSFLCQQLNLCARVLKNMGWQVGALTPAYQPIQNTSEDTDEKILCRIVPFALQCIFDLWSENTLWSATNPSTNPDDYTIKVHISGIHFRSWCTGDGSCEQEVFADTVINGQKIELNGVLRSFHHDHQIRMLPGDYLAHLLKNTHRTSDTPLFQRYDILMPDKTVWQTSVTGISE